MNNDFCYLKNLNNHLPLHLAYTSPTTKGKEFAGSFQDLMNNDICYLKNLNNHLPLHLAYTSHHERVIPMYIC